ncbi:MAG TPA: TlpA disulfide reductase family protein [Burkholderiales bacterium]|nr:TlpA disulfide reductase family protein [Burkholderiales bacterium]
MNPLLCVLLAAGLAWPALAWPAGLEGQPAPALEAKLLDGNPFRLADAAGKVVLVNYWATWCEPCRAEMPAIDAYYRRHRDEGLAIVAVSMDKPSDEAKVREVMKSFAFPAAFVKDVNARGYGRIWRIPVTFVIDRKGVVRKDGWFVDPGIDEASLDAVVTPLLRAP